MKGKIRFITALLVCIAAGCALLPAESLATASKEDFDTLTVLWNRAHEENSYTDYQDKLAALAQSVIPDDLYQYMFGEALFYRYYAGTYISMPENTELDESLSSTIQFCLSEADEYPALRTVFELFRSLSKAAPYGALSNEPLFSGLRAERPVEKAMLPDADAGRLLMLRTLAEAEAMNQRLIKASESRGGDVLLKFSKEAYLNVMEKPAMVYVINNEPVYTSLRGALERSSDGVETESFGEAADAFYMLESLIVQCEEIAASKGVPLSAILSEEAWTAMMLYHTDPFAVLSLNVTALKRLNGELSFVAEKSLQYIDRINALPEKRDEL